MNIVLLGASGYIGAALLQEALKRGHRISTLSREAGKLASTPALQVSVGSVFDTATLQTLFAGKDAVISAFSGHSYGDVRGEYLRGVRSIIDAARASGRRLLMVGGAGSLEIAPGVQLLDSPEFPAQWRASAEGARDALNLLRSETELNWTMLSPAALIEPGPATGHFRLGGNQLLSDAQGQSRISTGDYAVAMLDELESPRHLRQRFTVAY
ncbi:hypothetical protein SAMN04488038_103250 [Solimonas aquatica]|uniref:NAD(P)-binding domain-containing protein n=1 Tax=Solimonas aquatica TaxID=489703 RepID=A0A1H9D043_9GAMM|nr:NAD(P)-dependent oxidoreductase [Solimonas aquatica]SEQ06749.1 hypothetical protein SAMN04488038_103250 [Solimonas aquatica]